MTTAVLTDIPLSWSESKGDRLEMLRKAVQAHLGVLVRSKDTFPTPRLTADVPWSDLDSALYTYCIGLGVSWHERGW